LRFQSREISQQAGARVLLEDFRVADVAALSKLFGRVSARPGPAKHRSSADTRRTDK
jgi:hypothetical protein